MSAEYLHYLHNVAVESGEELVLGDVEEMELQFDRKGISYKKNVKTKTGKDKKMGAEELSPLAKMQEAYKLSFGENRFTKTPPKYTNNIEWLRDKINSNK